MKSVPRSHTVLARILLLFLLGLFLAGCQLNAEPIDVGFQNLPRPLLGLRLKVVHKEHHIIEDEALEKTNKDQNRALLVIACKEKSPAQKGGVLPGDILLEIEGVPVQGVRDSTFVMQRKRPGDDVALTLYRIGKIIKIGIHLPADVPVTKATNSPLGGAS